MFAKVISWFDRDEIKQYNNNDFNVNLNVQAFFTEDMQANDLFELVVQYT